MLPQVGDIDHAVRGHFGADGKEYSIEGGLERPLSNYH
jgi:hypothetical protein